MIYIYIYTFLQLRIIHYIRSQQTQQQVAFASDRSSCSNKRLSSCHHLQPLVAGRRKFLFGNNRLNKEDHPRCGSWIYYLHILHHNRFGDLPLASISQMLVIPQAAVAKPVPRGPAGPALDVKSGLSLEVVTGKAAWRGLEGLGYDWEHFFVGMILFVKF